MKTVTITVIFDCSINNVYMKASTGNRVKLTTKYDSDGDAVLWYGATAPN